MAQVIPVTTLSRDGITPAGAPTQVLNDGGFALTMARGDGRNFLEVINNSGTTARTITMATPGDVQGLAIADTSVTIPAASTRLVGPFGGVFGDPVSITVSGGLDLSFRAYNVPGV